LSNKYLIFILLIIPVILFDHCANPVSPTGGKKDTTPPRPLTMIPPDFTTSFNSNRIKITFNEFIQIKDPKSKVTISPPLLPNTDFLLHGKSLIIKLNDSLLPNTTYSFNFGESISDLQENNILHDFTYVFTTGTHIDSLSLKGTVVDAFDLSVQKDLQAMLFINENDTLPFDSLPYKVRPYYLARTNENGEFIFHNLRSAPYKLFALKDQNSNFLYDLPTEKIAFLDSLATGTYIPPEFADSVKVTDTTQNGEKPDSTLVKEDTTLTDTSKKLHFPFHSYHLRLFEEIDSTQKVFKSEMVQENEVRLVFKLPTIDPEFNPINFTPDGKWMMPEFSKKRDTVLLWLVKPPKDSLVMLVNDKGRKTDTVTLSLTVKSKKKKSAGKDKTKPERVSFTSTFWGGHLNQFWADPEITSSYPLTGALFPRFVLIDGKDTVKISANFPDSLKRKIVFHYKWKEDGRYTLIIPDSSLFSANGLTNDTLRYDFQALAVKNFGSIRMAVSTDSLPGTFIIQLLDDKENILREKTITQNEKIVFDYLFPGKYKLKAILDRNKNGHWDSGIYLKHLQPEEVFYYPKPIEVRGNWDIDETWLL
jgi:hypothetical protein